MPCKDVLLKARDELKSKQFWKGLRCELLGTILYVIFGCSASLSTDFQDDHLQPILTALSFGFAETVVVASLGHASGGHFNPALTIGMFVTRYLTFLKALSFVIVQCFGGIVAVAILYGIAPTTSKSTVGMNIINKDINEGQAFGFEFLATLLVTYAFFASLENKNDILVADHLICGVAVSLAGLFTSGYTGCSLNPARSLGPAVIHNDWGNLWLYWIAPVLGGVLGAFTFEYTKDSSKHLDDFRSSLRQRVYTLQRKDDLVSCNSVATDVNGEQEMTTEEVQM